MDGFTASFEKLGELCDERPVVGDEFLDGIISEQCGNQPHQSQAYGTPRSQRPGNKQYRERRRNTEQFQPGGAPRSDRPFQRQRRQYSSAQWSDNVSLRPAVINNCISAETRRAVIQAMGHARHIYAIGECGMPMVTSTCPQCHAVIGGKDHELLPSNRSADAAMYEGTGLNRPNYRLSITVYKMVL
uniref:RZ-type domain-containing protein n=1 Tax=Panagrolaimus sp. PS1159 TaxID=55785 RepID=A0AC35GNY6_9BILA